MRSVTESSTTYLVEVASVLVSVEDAHGTAKNGNVNANGEVFGHVGAAIRSKNDLALKEVSLGNARVDLLRLGDHDGLVLKEVANSELSATHVLEAALDDTLLEVTEESQDL